MVGILQRDRLLNSCTNLSERKFVNDCQIVFRQYFCNSEQDHFTFVANKILQIFQLIVLLPIKLKNCLVEVQHNLIDYIT